MNRLTENIHGSVNDIESALEGTIPLSDEIEEVMESVKTGRVPREWLKYSYPSDKPLGLYITDLVRRLKYFQEWIDGREPVVHWISAYFFI